MGKKTRGEKKKQKKWGARNEGVNERGDRYEGI